VQRSDILAGFEVDVGAFGDEELGDLGVAIVCCYV